MFFKDIYSWDSFKLKKMRILYYALYYLFATFLPLVAIGINYRIFEKHTGFGFTGFGLCLAVCIVTIFVKKMLSVIEDMDDIDQKDQQKKFTIQMIIALVLPATAMYVLWLLDRNWDTAISTLRWCIASWTICIIINYTCCRSLDVAKRIQKEAKKQIAVNKQVDALRK